MQIKRWHTACVIMGIALLHGRSLDVQEIYTYENDSIKVVYTRLDGRIDGSYQSYYKNGQLRAKGQFADNYRIGKWSLWDSMGVLQIERVYESPFVYKAMFPEVPSIGPIPILSQPVYKPRYNDSGYIEYFDIMERMCMWTKSLDRKIEPADNGILFDNDQLFKLLMDNVLEKKIRAFSLKNDEFTDSLDITLLAGKTYQVDHYKIREDWIFDSDRMLMEARIIGICPVVKVENELLDLYWLFFPEIRSCLAKEKLNDARLPKHIKTVDDVFFYRCFRSEIFREGYYHRKMIADYKTGDEIVKEAERIELEVIETEHEMWLYFSGQRSRF